MGVRSNAWMKPSEIRFIQDSISPNFQNGGNVHDAIRAIEKGVTTPDDFPPIKVVRKDGKIYSFDNRRLYVFRVCEYRGYITDIPVIVMPLYHLIEDKVTTDNDGIEVRVRRGRTEMHYRDHWLRERDTNGNLNLPPKGTSVRQTPTNTDVIDGPSTWLHSNTDNGPSLGNNVGNTFRTPNVYTISSNSHQLDMNSRLAHVPRPTTPNTANSAHTHEYAAKIPPVVDDSHNSILSRYLDDVPRPTRSSFSRRVQLAANYGTGADNHEYLSSSSSTVTDSEEDIESPQMERKEGSRSVSSKRSKGRYAPRTHDYNTIQVATSNGLHPPPATQDVERQQVPPPKRSLFKRFLSFCCCCCVGESDE